MYTEAEINTIAQAIEENTKKNLRIWLVHKDLAETRNALLRALKSKGPGAAADFGNFTSALQQSLEIISPFEAYMAGHARHGASEKSALINYMEFYESVAQQPYNYVKSEELILWHAKVIGWLKNDDLRPLVSDYMQLYRQYNGIQCRNLRIFFTMGYEQTA